MPASCYHCGAALKLDGPVGRRTTCPECDGDVRCCMNCRHYDESAAHQCREPHAEQVVEKEASNACDLFQLGDGAARRQGDRGATARGQLAALFGEAPKPREDPHDALEALFKKR
ncbi:hypothetical protein [Anaeromyxobacter paludicola]|uniref:Uncharacterized protein n=1 Tax=Anaeromyxobacter paludicola TaxID=2918171 RepID=A0ABN6N186_9BACT|nr:hypothetical protein [Anaeromyxobacter paludicola]BDG06941.1 hypothetical protein AMPC_00540 [Anaeromyxobacter paludicola]